MLQNCRMSRCSEKETVKQKGNNHGKADKQEAADC